MIKKYLILLFMLLALWMTGLGCQQRSSEEGSSAEDNTIKAAKNRYSSERAGGRKRQRLHQLQTEGGGNAPVDPGKNKRRTSTIWTDDIQVVALSPEEEATIEIETTKAANACLKCSLEATGKVLAPQHRKAIVSYAFPARIAQIHIGVGDWVKKGQKLVTLQSEEVGSAKTEFYKAEADFELAKVNYERVKRLHDRGVGAKKDFLTAGAELKVAEANLDAAEKKLHVLGFSEEQVKVITETHQINPVITLFAPISGKVIENKCVLGAMIDQSTEILTIMDPTLLWIDADVYEKDIAKIKIGLAVEVRIPAYPGEIFRGKTSYISDVLDEDTRTITVRTEVNNQDNRLKAGMFANVQIHLNHQSQTLVVPVDAVLDDKDRTLVFLKRGGVYVPCTVKTGTQEKGYVEILSGLNKGDEVVTKGSFQLKSKLYEALLHEGHVH